jgi:glyoxylase-like metal-dependent hydrolase (beta-lactamase superfamily II)
VLRIRLPIVNVYVVRQARCVLVDAGTPGSADRILRGLARHGIAPREISLLLLTHGHMDHFGSARELRERTGAPVAIHAADVGPLAAGHNPPLKPINVTARLLAPFFKRQIAPFQPDFTINTETQLERFGIAGRVIWTPGHTAGSVSILLADGELIAGDLLMGGYAGGYVRPSVPGYPYFLDDLGQTHASIEKILSLPLSRVHVGHGGPLAPAAIRNRFARQAEGVKT